MRPGHISVFGLILLSSNCLSQPLTPENQLTHHITTGLIGEYVTGYEIDSSRTEGGYYANPTSRLEYRAQNVPWIGLSMPITLGEQNKQLSIQSNLGAFESGFNTDEDWLTPTGVSFFGFDNAYQRTRSDLDRFFFFHAELESEHQPTGEQWGGTWSKQNLWGLNITSSRATSLNFEEAWINAVQGATLLDGQYVLGYDTLELSRRHDITYTKPLQGAWSWEARGGIGTALLLGLDHHPQRADLDRRNSIVHLGVSPDVHASIKLNYHHQDIDWSLGIGANKRHHIGLSRFNFSDGSSGNSVLTEGIHQRQSINLFASARF